MKKVKIDLADRSYDILIGRGLLDRTGEFLKDRVKTGRVIVITHPGINRLYGERVIAGLRQNGFNPERIEIPEGEGSKTLTSKSISPRSGKTKLNAVPVAWMKG